VSAQRDLEHHLDATAQIALGTADGGAALERMAQHHATFVLRNPDRAAAWQRAAGDGPATAAWHFRRIWRLYVEEWVNTLCAHRPDLGDAEARTAVHAVLALLQSPTRYESGLPEPLVIELLTAMALGALASAAPSEPG
jgi:hypothetical protein